MLRALFLFFALLSISASAQDFAFRLDHIRLNEFSRLVLSEVLHENYIFGPEFLADESDLTLEVSKLSKDDLLATLRVQLNARGFDLAKSKGLYRITKSDSTEDKEFFFYRPKYRDVRYIVDLSTSLFPHGRFSGQRAGIPSSATTVFPPNQPQQAPQQPAQFQPPTDSGSSAFSLVDKDIDAFIFEAPARDVERLQKLLAQIDTPSPEVLVKAMVFEVSSTEKEGSAVGLAINLLSGKLGIRIGDLSKNLGNAVTVKTTDVEAVFSALSQDTRFKVVSSPSLRVRNGGSARFSSGADVPVLGSIQLDKNGNPIQSIDYRPSGVIFNLKPKIREGEVELTLTQQLSNFIPTTSGVNNSPTLIKRELSTNITAQPDEFIFLGGLEEEKASEDSSGLSFLPSWLHSQGKEIAGLRSCLL
jgi:Type II secretory pathway, component PulD